MKRGRKQELAGGEEFVVPLNDGSYGYGQVLAVEPLTLENSVICAFFTLRSRSMPIKALGAEENANVMSVLWVTRDLLDNGTWKVYGRSEPLDLRAYVPDIDDRRAKGFVGTKVYGSGIARKLVNAYFGLHPWDGFAEPDYLDKLLLNPTLKPAGVLLTKESSRNS